MTTFFTSDLHIGHERCAVAFRPHSSLEDMHNFIITTWNTNITSADDVYVLGDIFMGEWKTLAKANEFLNLLNFKSFNVIPGNHDKPNFLRELSIYRGRNGKNDFDVSITHIVEKRFPVETKNIKMYPLVCSHYPLASWSTVAKGIGHVHGHCHMAYKGRGRILDVGWDGFYTERKKGIWSVDDIKEYMNKQEIFSVDYH